MSSNSAPVNKKPRLKKKNTSKAECEIIRNVHSFFQGLKDVIKLQKKVPGYEDTWLPCSFENVLEMTNEATKVSIRTISRIISQKCECDSENLPKPDDKIRNRKNNFECDDFTVSYLRRVLYGFYERKEHPTLSMIREKCLENPNFPKISRSLLHSWIINKCKFKFKKFDKKPIYLDREDVKTHRIQYLKDVRSYREQGYKIYYSDETWTNPEMCPTKGWQMQLDNSELKEFCDYGHRRVLGNVNGWVGGHIRKTGNGRIIVNSVGSEDGFLSGAEDIFKCTKSKSADYHDSMTGERYLSWAKKTVELLPNKSVLVIDQAPYHKLQVPETIMAKESWKKDKIINNIATKHLQLPEPYTSHPELLTKRELVGFSDCFPTSPKYMIETIIEESNKDIKLLWLPVAHPELNPIELIWSSMKQYVKKNNVGKTLGEMLPLTYEAYRLVTPELWKSCVQHVIKDEEKFWKRDKIRESRIKTQIAKIIIPLNESDTEPSDLSSSDSDSE